MDSRVKGPEQQASRQARQATPHVGIKAAAVIIIVTGNRGHNADAVLANAFSKVSLESPWQSGRLGGWGTTFYLLPSYSNPLFFSSRPFFSISLLGLCVFLFVSASVLEGSGSGAAVRDTITHNSKARRGRGMTM